MLILVTPVTDVGLTRLWQALQAKHQLKRDTIATAMGISGPQLSQILAGSGQLSISRLLMAALDRDVRPFVVDLWRALGAEHLGLTDQEAAAAMREFLDRVDRMQMLKAAPRGRKEGAA